MCVATCLSLDVAERGVDAHGDVLEDVLADELGPGGAVRDLGAEGVAHLGALEALPLVVQEGRRLGRGHQALLHQSVQRPTHHQLHLQG